MFETTNQNIYPQKNNVESTKVYKVVKLEKSVGFVQQTLTVSTFITGKISLR